MPSAALSGKQRDGDEDSDCLFFVIARSLLGLRGDPAPATPADIHAEEWGDGLPRPNKLGLAMTSFSDNIEPPDFGGLAWRGVPVSHETQMRLQRYAGLLVEWNAKFNLVASSTLPQLWTRHMLDSAQLFPLLPKGTKRLVDLGSGAGFPALVLSILGVPEVHVIESIGKKARFLQAVTDDLGLNVIVHNARIESVRDVQADVVTARALTALPTLLSLAKPFMGPASSALFLKGEKADAELTEAAKYWTFGVEKHPSLSDPSGMILRINELKVLRKHDPKRHK